MEESWRELTHRIVTFMMITFWLGFLIGSLTVLTALLFWWR